VATIRVYHDEKDGGDFPPLCMRCGADAEASVPQKFAWMPPWVHVFILLGLLPWLLAAALTRRTMRVTAPMCARHVNHWLSRKLYIGLGLLWWIGFAIVFAVFADHLPKDAVAPIGAAALVGALVWLLIGVVLAHRAIRAAEIRESGIELANVNKEFARAWKMRCEVADRRSQPRMRRRPESTRPVQPWTEGARKGDDDYD
jgi:hypothetical protein